MLYLPSERFLKGVALGFDEILSDILWIKALAYFGGHAVTDQDYTWLGHILDIVTSLDPLFSYPYEFGGIILTTEVGDVEKSNSLLKKGMENVPKSNERYWYYPFFIAFNHMYYKNDYKTAAHYLEIASKFPQSPSYLPLLVSRLYSNANSLDVAITFLSEMIKSSQKPELKEKLKQRLNEIINQSNIQFLETAKNNFFLEFYRYPHGIGELFTNGLIFFIPADPRGGTYYISKENGSIENTKKSDLSQVYIDKSSKFEINIQPIK